MLHWLIARSADGRVAAPDLRAILDAPTPPTGLAAVHAERWTSVDGRTEAALWSDDGRPWTVDDSGGVAALVGRPWDHTASDGAVLRADMSASSPDAVRRLDGRFTILVLDRHGHGWVRSDRFGLSPVYRGAAGGSVFVANRPALIFAAMAALGHPPSRDLDTARHVAVLGTAFGDESGYQGIRRVRDRHDLDFRAAAEPVEVETWPHPWEGDGPCVAGDDRAVVAAVTERLVAGMGTLVRNATVPVEAELTGGLDSRLVLALARLAGVAGEIRFHTFGSPAAEDARVAWHLSKEFGLRWEMRRARGGVSSPEGLVAAVALVSGEFGAGGHVPPSEGTILLSGMMGEALSAKYVNFVPRVGLHAVRRQTRILSQRQPFTRRAAVRRTMTEVAADMRRSMKDGCSPADMLDAFYLRQRERRWIGSRPDRWDRNLFPLYCPDAIVGNLRLPPDDRQGARIHRSVIAAAGLPVEVSAEGLPEAPPLPRLQRLPSMRYPSVLRSVVASCRDSPAMDFVDVDALTEGIASFSSLPRVPRQRLTDAVVSLVWAQPGLAPDAVIA